MTGVDHAWDLSPADAKAVQERLRGLIRQEPLAAGEVRLVAGCDLSAQQMRGEVFAGVVVVDLATGETVDEAGVVATTQFPYIPGLLSFREVPPLSEAWRRLTVAPEVLVCDGQGYAHPRRCGLACHAGLALEVPTVGCAKSLLVGRVEPPGDARGATADIVEGDEVIGRAVRTRPGVKPVYVSIGYRCRLDDAVELVLRCATRYRLPEPTRRAHEFVNRLRRGEVDGCVIN